MKSGSDRVFARRVRSAAGVYVWELRRAGREGAGGGGSEFVYSIDRKSGPVLSASDTWQSSPTPRACLSITCGKALMYPVENERYARMDFRRSSMETNDYRGGSRSIPTRGESTRHRMRRAAGRFSEVFCNRLPSSKEGVAQEETKCTYTPFFVLGRIFFDPLLMSFKVCTPTGRRSLPEEELQYVMFRPPCGVMMG